MNMKTKSFIVQLIILILILIPGAIIKNFRKNKEEERLKKHAEDRRKQELSGYKKIIEDKNNIANTIDQSIYSKVDFKEDYDIDKMVNWINRYVLPKLLTPQYKQRIKDEIYKYYGSSEDERKEADEDMKTMVIKAENFDDEGIIIVDGEQMIRIACSFIVYDIADILCKAFEGKKEFGTGDGDEGTVYLK